MTKAEYEKRAKEIVRLWDAYTKAMAPKWNAIRSRRLHG